MFFDTQHTQHTTHKAGREKRHSSSSPGASHSCAVDPPGGRALDVDRGSKRCSDPGREFGGGISARAGARQLVARLQARLPSFFSTGLFSLSISTTRRAPRSTTAHSLSQRRRRLDDDLPRNGITAAASHGVRLPPPYLPRLWPARRAWPGGGGGECRGFLFPQVRSRFSGIWFGRSVMLGWVG